MYYVTVIALSHHVSVVMCFVHIIIIIIIIQRLSMLIQRFNSALIMDSFCFADEDPDL